MRVPNFLCIGAQKAGTSWLEVMLRQHDQIFLPPIKEVHFYDYLYMPGHDAWIRSSFQKTAAKLRKTPEFTAYIDRLSEIPRRSEAWYSEIFSLPEAEGRLLGEITPAYSILPVEGIRHVKWTNPDVRIIYILRDPVDRALSQLRMAANRGGSSAVGEKDLKKMKVERVLARSSYEKSISRWESVFPTEQMLFLPYSRISSDPASFLASIETFLGVDSRSYGQSDEKVHQTKPVEISQGVEEFLVERLQGERRFLADRFGPEFARQN